METQVFWDILSTPEQMNSKRWVIERCTGMRKHLTRGKEYDQHWKLELDPPEKKQQWSMMNLKLLSIFLGNHRIRTLTGKKMENLHIHKMDTWLRYLSPWRKRVGGWENKGILGKMEQTPLRKLRIDLADVENDRIQLKRSTPGGKNWHDNLDDQEGLVFT